MTPEQQDALLQRMADRYGTDKSTLKSKLDSIGQRIDDINNSSYATSRDIKRGLDKAHATADRLQEMIRSLDPTLFDAGEENVLSDLDFALSSFRYFVENFAKPGVPRQQSSGVHDNILIRRLMRLLRDLTGRCKRPYWSKQQRRYEGPFVGFLKLALVYLDMAESGEQAEKLSQSYAQKTVKLPKGDTKDLEG